VFEASALRVGGWLGDGGIRLPAAGLTSSTACQPTFATRENPGAPRGIFAYTMDEKCLRLPPTRLDMPGGAAGCPSLSIAVYWINVGHAN
jgi:hypothetical protein